MPVRVTARKSRVNSDVGNTIVRNAGQKGLPFRNGTVWLTMTKWQR